MSPDRTTPAHLSALETPAEIAEFERLRKSDLPVRHGFLTEQVVGLISGMKQAFAARDAAIQALTARVVELERARPRKRARTPAGSAEAE